MRLELEISSTRTDCDGCGKRIAERDFYFLCPDDGVALCEACARRVKRAEYSEVARWLGDLQRL